MVFLNLNHAAMRCRTTVRHLLRPWHFVLWAEMRWQVKVTRFWWTVDLNMPFASQDIECTGPPACVGKKGDFIFQHGVFSNEANRCTTDS
jgi:hypothetical protein